MKKNSVLAIIAMAILATTVAVVSCKKEKQEQTTNNDLVTSQLSEMDRAMLAFGERLKSSGNVDETMPLEEAIHTFSNYENFLLCSISYNAPEKIRDTFEVELPVSNGMVRLSDINQLLATNKAKILARFNILDGAEKELFFISSRVLEEGTTEQSVRIQTVVCMQNSPDRYDPYPVLFGSTDYWKDFGLLGKCGSYEGQCVGQDAVSKLQQKLREWLPLPACNGTKMYLTDTTTVLLLSIAFPDGDSPNGYYAMPYNPNMSIPMCVSPEEMRWYYESIKEIYEHREDIDPIGRRVLGLELEETEVGNSIFCGLRLMMYKVNCSEAIDNGGD